MIRTHFAIDFHGQGISDEASLIRRVGRSYQGRMHRTVLPCFRSERIGAPNLAPNSYRTNFGYVLFSFYCAGVASCFFGFGSWWAWTAREEGSDTDSEI